MHSDPGRFVDVPVVVTEKLDGSNILLHNRKTYGRSVSTPSEGKWTAMVKKHHAWKVTEPDVFLYGEDVYGIHSIEYGAVREDHTFYAFSRRDATGAFAPFSEVRAYAEQKNIPIVPILFHGIFGSIAEVRKFLLHAHAEASVLGGEREGVVLRLACGFPESEFQYSVCKSVRIDHVQSTTHWTTHWRPCKIARDHDWQLGVELA